MYSVPPIEPRHDPYAALRFRDFRLLIIGIFFAIIGEQMISVALGWELYERTNSAFVLGLIGLVQVIPVVLLALPAGHVADRFDRKKIMLIMLATLALCSLGLGILSWMQGSLMLIFLCLLGIGIARSFQGPASSALLPQLLPEQHYANAATWQSTAWQSSSIIGPALGGLIIAATKHATLIYFIDAAILLLMCGLISLLRPRPVQLSGESMTLSSLLAGLKFVVKTKVILASITLDMFAVLLGGATALLPIFARDILHVGPTGLGWLRTAPAVGAVLAAVMIAHLPPFKRAGWTLLSVVAGFGIATIVFGWSRSFPLSLAMLALLGALDSVSVVIRSTLLLLRTPDDMRGRVNAVHNVFVGISNELGAFESGVAAALLGTVGAVVIGGFGTLAVVGLIAIFFPEVRRLGRLTNDPETDQPILLAGKPINE